MKAFIPGSVGLYLAIVAGSGLAQISISLEGTTHVRHDSVLAPGSTHTLTLRYNASGAPAGSGYLTSNGFRIYSPDGADWVSVQGVALPSFTDLGWGNAFVNHFNVTGGTGRYGMPLTSGGGNVTGKDTVVILLAGVNSQPDGGLPPGFNDLTMEIQFQSRREDAGLHICFDTCQGAPGATWEWAKADDLIKPAWSGRRCFVISCCEGQVGDVNGINGDEPTLGDIMTLVNFLFVDGTRPDCLEESDVNQSGSTVEPPLGWEDVTLADIMHLVAHIFIDDTPLPECP